MNTLYQTKKDVKGNCISKFLQPPELASTNETEGVLTRHRNRRWRQWTERLSDGGCGGRWHRYRQR